MKKKIHPDYHYVVFQDLSSKFTFLTRSTIESEETIKWENGETYPLVKIEISSKSHPFYTGKQRIVDTDNRVDTFKKKMARKDTKALAQKRTKRITRRTKVSEIKQAKGLTLKDMLKQME